MHNLLHYLLHYPAGRYLELTTLSFFNNDTCQHWNVPDPVIRLRCQP